MSDLLERLRDRGWRLTAQRRIIAEVLNGPNTHLTADEVLERAREQLPEVSLTTVYKALNEFVEAGEVSQLVLNDGVKRYDPNVERRHQHLVCVGCDTVVDVSLEHDPSLPDDERHDFDIRSVEVTFRGVCPACGTGSGAP